CPEGLNRQTDGYKSRRQTDFHPTGCNQKGWAANRRGGIWRSTKTKTAIMKKRLILILNGKGGVGKSFFAVNLVQYLKDRQIAHAAFDSDDENSTLKRFHSEAEFINVN